MKIFYIDTFLDGHHLSYIKGLCAAKGNEYVLALPQLAEDLPAECKQMIVPYEVSKRGFLHDLKWLHRVYKLVEKEKPDIVHFLYGDLWYRYFGVGFNLFRNYKTVITFHTIPNTIKHRVSLKMISGLMDRCIVHTEKLMQQVGAWGIKNAKHIEYPCFFPVLDTPQREVRNALSIPCDATVFACLGGTRKYKGLDFMLEALKKVKGEFHLLIAGSAEHFTKEMINRETAGYQSKVTLMLHQLSDDEFMKALAAADWIVLPYRRAFAGASGPLAEGVMYGKRIIGTRSGSIGDLISRYDLGKTFESENVDALAAAIEAAINERAEPSEKYKNYQRSLLPDTFVQKYQALYCEELSEE